MAESDDLRAFIRDIMTRSDKKTAAWERAMEAADRKRHAEFMARHEETMARLREDRVKLDEILAEGRAQRGALLAILDRMNGGGPETA